MDEESIDHTSDTDIDKEDDDAELVTDNDFEEDFDKFEAGAEDEDFGDFDEGSQQSSIPDATPEKTRPPIQSAQAVTLPTVPFVSMINSLSSIMTTCIAFYNTFLS